VGGDDDHGGEVGMRLRERRRRLWRRPQQVTRGVAWREFWVMSGYLSCCMLIWHIVIAENALKGVV
jgi:hypothetical protein